MIAPSKSLLLLTLAALPTVLSAAQIPGQSGAVVSWGSTVIPYLETGTGFIAISAGGSHNVALKADGRPVAWGNNDVGQSTLPAGLTGAQAVAAGSYHNLALKSDGTVAAWGRNDCGQSTVPGGLTGVAAIAVGGLHSLALKSNGTVVAWGGSNYFQTSVPAGLTGVVAVAAGANHSLALKRDGTVVAWGSNFWYGYYGESSVPTELTGVTAIAAGEFFSLALQSNGTVVAWGKNDSGQSTVPAGLSGVKSIAAGKNHSLALKSDGTLVGWGAGISYPDGVPSALSGVVAISAGGSHNMALLTNGAIVSWGDNYYGQSTDLAILHGVAAISAGANYNLALKSDGTVIAWGDNHYGQATPPSGLNGVVAISGNLAHSLALKHDGTVVAWGNNLHQQSTVPPEATEVSAIAAGMFHSLALTSNGFVTAWGDNSYGQSTVPTGLAEVSAIAAGGYHSLALKSNGTVVAWGAGNQTNWPGFGQTTVPEGLTGVTAIAAGSFHSLALKSDGTVIGWGNTNLGQTIVPTGLNGVVVLAAGGFHNTALTSNGTVVAWGNPDCDQSTIPGGLMRVVAIAAGGNHSLGVEVTINPPVILLQPMNQTVLVGESATFRVAADYGTPLAYIWRRNGLPIPGATNSSYSFENCTFADSGSHFSCVVSNDYGIVVSSDATLTAIPSLPNIEAQPASQNVLAGRSATFCVKAQSDTPCTYLWLRQGIPIPGANQACYTATNCQLADFGTQYSCLVSNASGAVASSNALLTVFAWMVPMTLCNPEPQSIEGTTAQPYPSTILVSNVGGIISRISVTLSNLAHTYPRGVHILLAGPGDEKVLLMSDAGGAYPCTNITLIFDDRASMALPMAGSLTSRHYRPTDNIPGDSLPGPAPAGPYGTNLSVFNGINPNGLWSLYIADDGPVDADGVLANGWSLNFEIFQSELTATPEGTNLMISWPAIFSGYLEATSDLTPPITWRAVSPQPTILEQGGRKTITLPKVMEQYFYRLRQD